MTRRRIGMCIAAGLVAMAAVSGRVWSQDEASKKAGGMQDMMEMMKKCMAAAKPGPSHKLLESMAGDWNAKTKMWMDPSAPPSESSGKSKLKLIMDGRFLMDEFDGTISMPNAKGEMEQVPMKGMGITGFDNAKNQYIGSWIDSLGTQMLTMSGSYNPVTKTLQMFGSMDDLAMGVYGKTIRYETKIINDDKHTFTMYDCHAGIDYKVMEVTYTRAK